MIDLLSIISKKQGGGLLTLVKNNLHFEILTLQYTMLEIQATRIIFNKVSIIIINTYIPPYKSMKIMIDEFKEVLTVIKKQYPIDQITIIGDFNMTNTIWKYDEDSPGFLIQKAINICGRMQ